MASYLSWGANAVLIAAGCVVTANMASGIIGEWVAPPGAVPGEVHRPASDTPQTRSTAVIINRNLLGASLESAEPAEFDPNEITDELEATSLPLRLLGTVASTNPNLARAALEETETRERLVVGITDQISGKATVMRIEQRRIVLAEDGGLRELSLDDDKPPAPVPTVRRASADRKRRSRPEPRPRKTPSIAREQIQDAMRDPTKLFQQARFLPKFEDGGMLGLQINAIKEGSLLEDVGLEDGDIITEANGMAMDSPTASAELFRELNEADDVVVQVQRANGATEEIVVSIDD